VIAIDHPVKLCRALIWAFAVFYWNSEAENYEEYVDRLLVEAREHALVVLQTIGETMKGIVLMARGETEAGFVLLKASIEKMHGYRLGPVTDFSVQLAGALAITAQCDEALNTIDRAIARARHHNFLLEMPDLLRVKGEVLISMKSPDFAQAESCLRQSLDLAQRQGALGFELRTAVSLAKLRLQQGRREEARGMLAPVYARFTEGFNSRLLTAARELLDEPGSPHSGSLATN
jgi:tetratricopeptide (TPR) repeat protein